jgi:hypothetical protein
VNACWAVDEPPGVGGRKGERTDDPGCIGSPFGGQRGERPGERRGASFVAMIADAVKSELDALPDGLGTSALGETARELARRLDSCPADRQAVQLSGELRLC